MLCVPLMACGNFSTVASHSMETTCGELQRTTSLYDNEQQLLRSGGSHFQKLFVDRKSSLESKILQLFVGVTRAKTLWSSVVNSSTVRLVRAAGL